MQKTGIGFWLAIALLNGGVALADIVTLNNGDQLQGKVLREQGDTLIFKAAMFPRPLEIPLDSVASLTEPHVEAPQAAIPASEAGPPSPQTASKPKAAPAHQIEAPKPPKDPAPLPSKTASKKTERFQLPENWDARLGIGYSDRKNETAKNREFSAEGKLAWKNDKQEAEWKAHYHYQTHENKKSADRYGASQRLRHRGEKGFYLQAQTRAEVDNVTKNRTQFSQTAGLGYSPIKNEKLTVNVTPGFKGEHVADAEREEQEGTSYKAHVQQDLKWKVSDSVSLGQGLSYSVDPRHTENWDMDFKAFVETKVSDDVNLRVNYRRDFLNQADGAPDKESSELGAALVWDF